MNLNLENLSGVRFARQEVLEDNMRIHNRTYNLRRAVLLGNLYKRKVMLKIRTVEGIVRNVEARVWAMGSEYISLRGGLSVPIKSVEDVEL